MQKNFAVKFTRISVREFFPTEHKFGDRYLVDNKNVANTTPSVILMQNIDFPFSQLLILT